MSFSSDALEPESKEVEIIEEQRFSNFFRSLPSADEDTIRIFERGSNYTSHGEDAEYVSQKVYHTRTVLKFYDQLASCSMPLNLFRTFLGDALKCGKKIEIWKPDRSQRFVPSRKASPGNTREIEDLLISSREFEESSIVLAAISFMDTPDSKKIGLCFVDTLMRSINFCEFDDNENFSNLEAVLIQTSVRECLVFPNEFFQKNLEYNKLEQMLQTCQIVKTEFKLNSDSFTDQDIKNRLKVLLKTDDTSFPNIQNTSLFNSKLIMKAFEAVVKYSEIVSNSTSEGVYNVEEYRLSQYMRLDATALNALNLLPVQNQNKLTSVYGVLNNTKTAAGARLLTQWIKQPLLNRDQIIMRQDLVQMFLDNLGLCQILRDSLLKLIPDIHRICKRLYRGTASLEDVVRIYQVEECLPQIVSSLQEVEGENIELLHNEIVIPLQQYMVELQKFKEMIENTIDLDALARHEYIIKADFNEELQRIQERLEDLKHEISQEHLSVGDEIGVDTEKKLKLEQHSTYGWCLRLTRTEASIIRGNSRYSELSAQKAGIYFTTKYLSECNREFQSLREKYQTQQSSLVKEIVKVASSYHPVFEASAMVIAHIDVFQSMAYAARQAPIPYTKPNLLDDSSPQKLILKGSRHPCMELLDGINFIANDCQMVKDESSFLIITGPNMGGKSTYIRQIGVIVLMAQIGSFVPATYAEISIFDGLLARIGAGDQQTKGISTFMAEMLEISSIIRASTPKSLLVIDELGRGTSTTDGFGLAWAISEYIIQKLGSFSLFATHFHELTALADQEKCAKNYHVTVHLDMDDDKKANGKPLNQNNLTLLYKVEEGVCDRSFGIHVAKLTGFPESVVEMAQNKAELLEDFSIHTKDHDVSMKNSNDEMDNKELRRILDLWAEECSNQNLEDEKECLQVFNSILSKRTKT